MRHVVGFVVQGFYRASCCLGPDLQRFRAFMVHRGLEVHGSGFGGLVLLFQKHSSKV